MKDKLTTKRPWNRVNLAVYAVSSNGTKPNMHICTYVSAVSMQPKRIMVAIYEGTQTLHNIRTNKIFVLQLLADTQFNLVNLLGKQSGKTINKISRLQKRNLISEWKDFYILKDALAVMHLKVMKEIPAGDHHLFLCDVTAHKNLHNGNILTTSLLHEKRIIRI
jgi:flavin reductase (DIM6/NTAB) family NADH-FMN oxidoreductase RutF